MWTERWGRTLTVGEEAVEPRNLLLASLPAAELERVSPLLHKVALTPRRVLQHAGIPIGHVYFIEEGLVSVLAKVDERNAVEVGLIGRDGAVGSVVVLGARTSSFSHFVQIGGSALRISVEDLDHVLENAPRLRESLQGYLHLAMIQSAQAAACGLRHSFEQRLASWLLTAHDRSNLDRLPITQDLLARSLGVRRPTVSDTFKQLQRCGVFAKDRGMIRIVDRLGLERIACRCYHTMCRQRDAWTRSKMAQKTLAAFALFFALLEIEFAVQ